MRILSAALVFALTATELLTEPAHAQPAGETRIDLAFDEADMRVRPDPKPGGVRHVFHIVLSNGNEVTEAKTATAWDGQAISNSLQEKLGGETDGKPIWHVVTSNSLVRFQDFPQSTLTMKVFLLPNKSCRLEVSAKLKPGFTEYEIYSIHKHQMAYYSKWDTSNPTCTIH
jgi:hypothetical protein